MYAQNTSVIENKVAFKNDIAFIAIFDDLTKDVCLQLSHVH